MFTLKQIVISLIVLLVVGGLAYYFLADNNDVIIEVVNNTDELEKLVEQVIEEEQEQEEKSTSIDQPKRKIIKEIISEPEPVVEGEDLAPEDQCEAPANLEDERENEEQERKTVRKMPQPRTEPSLYNLGNITGAPEDVFAENNWEV